MTWVQPPDLLAHELVASAHEGREVDDVAARWQSAGGSTEAPVGGVGAGSDDPALRDLAVRLLDELDDRPVDPGLVIREPDELAAIEQVWSAPLPVGADQAATVPVDRLLGAWAGRAAGCLLGKPVEKLPRHAIREILTSQGRWPLDDWFTGVGLPADVAARWPWNRRSAPTSLAETLLTGTAGMPEDDDLNFAMLALALVEEHGDLLTTDDVATAWLDNLPGGRVFTAERVAYRNLLLGERAPRTATRWNPFRDWIGAWIRTDVYGWTHPGDPAAAARLAWQDARLSHRRAGIHGAMFVAAASAAAVAVDGRCDLVSVLEAGLSVVPPQSRLAAAVQFGIELGWSGVSTEQALDSLHAAYGHLHWVHVLNNAALTAYALVAGEGIFDRSVPIAVMGGWDTDSVGATVGALCGALSGHDGLDRRWTEPLRNRVASSVPGFDGIGLDTLAERTLACLPTSASTPATGTDTGTDAVA